MGQLLSQPITEKNITLVQHDHISHSIGEMQGYRLTMEDAYCDLNASVVLDIQLQDLLKQNENKLRHQQYGDDNSINEEDDDDDDDDGIEKAASSISDSETDITEDKDLANTSTSNITTTSSSTVPTTATNTVSTTNDVNQNRTHSNDEHDTSTVIENLRRIISNSSIDSSSSSLQDNHHQQNDHNSKQRHHHHLHSVLNPLSHHSKNNHNNPIRRSEDSINSGKPKIRINIYGVFDGHGGTSASTFVGEHLPIIIRKELEKKIQSLDDEDKLQLINNDYDDIIYRINFIKLLKSSFMQCDSKFYKSDNNNSGSTAVLTLIFQNYIFVANSGDSRCIMSCHKGATKALSFDHKPKNLGELMRIKNDGGYVQSNRVNSVLALSRAFGDFSFKMHNSNNHQKLLNHRRNLLYNSSNISTTNSASTVARIGTSPTNSPRKFNTSSNHPNNNNNHNNHNNNNHNGNNSHSHMMINSTYKLTPPEEYQVTVEPDIIIHKILPTDEFLVIACDGIWDCYKSHNLIHLIRHNLSMGKKLPEIVETILDNCINMANTITGIGFDNMTIIIVALHENFGSLDNWYAHMKRKILNEKFGKDGYSI
ncbi:unnamed protein product [[Candida] boidinii]|uniref:protein-serine/threonine phosphatase n=1 Tax=Candida boidinii TaxID=5477 RepID=A0A9W6TAS7_CANBO|nr:phosphoprotein phosphatase activity protein [[Candida] boidinii]OWB85648.1 phosphoprotein phosphatase activity protein [[Candida] boidinii]GME85474.1 unnamed protein product [[Candida] boidinii]GMG05671.1 unnamed protein product [[Candida] boidinii]